MTQTCAVYARVSTDMQGESLENQVDYAEEYVRRLGTDFRLDEACVYTDFDQSGYYTRFLQRPAIQQALADAQAKRYDVIVFKEISRISRDQAEHVEIVSRFTQHGVRIIAINDNLDSDRPETLDLLGIHSVMAEMESKRISSRVSSGKKSLARRGHWVGEAPIGYMLEPETKRLEVDPKYQDIPPLIFRLFTQEGLGTFKIAEHLNTKGLLTKNNRLWSRVTVNRVLQNPAYVGDLVYGRTRNTLKRRFDETGYSKVKGRLEIEEADWVVVRDIHPALVSREDFQRAQSIMNQRSKQNPKRARHPLTGLLKCGNCGSGMVCQKQRYNGKEYRYYTCSRAFRFGRDLCDQPNVNATALEEAMLQTVLGILKPYEVGTITIEPKKQTRGNLQKRFKHLERDREKAQLGLERLLMETDLPQHTYHSLKETYVQAIQKAEAEIEQLSLQARKDAQLMEWNVTVKAFLNDLRNVHRSDFTELRRFFHSLIESITMDGMLVRALELKYNLNSFTWLSL